MSADRKDPEWIAEDLHLRLERNQTLLAQVRTVTSQLLGARTRSEALDIVLEIIANLLGCEDAAIFELDGRVLDPVRAVGEHARRATRVRVGEDSIGRCAEGQTPLYSDSGVLAAVPLVVAGRTRGVLVLFRLLPQKTELGRTDRDLLETVAGLCGLVLSALREEGPRV